MINKEPSTSLNKAEKFHCRVMGMLENYNLDKVDHYFKDLNELTGHDQSNWREIYRTYREEMWYPCWWYWYQACAVKVLKAKQVVELGADRGSGTLFMASELPKDGILYSVDIEDKWQYVPKDHPQIVRIQGNAGDLSIWPKEVDLGKTDLWVIDDSHAVDHVRNECKIYSPFWKEGTAVIFDDMDKLNMLFEEDGVLSKYDKYFDPTRNISGEKTGILVA